MELAFLYDIAEATMLVFIKMFYFDPVESKPHIITILGHTAAGKTGIAARVAEYTKGEIISADSRQVYKGMDLGTGKDYEDYFVNKTEIAVHLIDICEAGEEYNVFEFQKDFLKAFHDIRSRERLPVLCGGSGMYVESVLRQYEMLRVPEDKGLRKELEAKELEELKSILASFGPLHNRTDTDSRKRAIRAIEIAKYLADNKSEKMDFPILDSLTIGIKFQRDNRRNRITQRLKERLDQGLVEEVRALVKNGVSYEKLEYYGLEYKYISWYLNAKINYDEMFQQLNTAIHQFAKRQMTYFRGMERRGVEIKWLEGEIGQDAMLEEILRLWEMRKRS